MPKIHKLSVGSMNRQRITLVDFINRLKHDNKMVGDNDVDVLKRKLIKT